MIQALGAIAVLIVTLAVGFHTLFSPSTWPCSYPCSCPDCAKEQRAKIIRDQAVSTADALRRMADAMDGNVPEMFVQGARWHADDLMNAVRDIPCGALEK